MNAFGEGFGHGFFDVHAEDFFYARADEGVARLCIHDEADIGKTIYEASRKFLLFVEASLDFATGRYVHERALIAHDLPRGIANGGGRVEANDWFAILPDEHDFAAFDNGLAIHFSANDGAEGF